MLDIKRSYARQIILRLKRQGLLFAYPSFAVDKPTARPLKGKESSDTLKTPLEILNNVSKPGPKPQHLSPEEVLILTALPKQKKAGFLVTKDGEVFYAPGKGYLTAGAPAILAEYRKAKRTR